MRIFGISNSIHSQKCCKFSPLVNIYLQSLTPQHFRKSKKEVDKKLLTYVKALFKMAVAVLSFVGFLVVFVFGLFVLFFFFFSYDDFFSRNNFVSNSALLVFYPVVFTISLVYWTHPDRDSWSISELILTIF